jgi:hypothetical protein
MVYPKNILEALTINCPPKCLQGWFLPFKGEMTYSSLLLPYNLDACETPSIADLVLH